MDTSPSQPRPEDASPIDSLEDSGLTGCDFPPLPLPPWSMYTVLVSLVAGYFLIPLLVSNISMLINPFMNETGQLFVQQAVTLLTWIIIFACLRVYYGPIRQYLGLLLNRPLRYYIWEAVKLILLTTALTLAMNFMWSVLGKYFPGFVPEQKVPYADWGSTELIVLTCFAVLMAPLLEELIFRGLLQSTFHKVTTPTTSIWLTCLVFLMFHVSYFGDLKALVHVFVLGLCFGLWRERTKSLVPGMIAHGFNNGLASLLILTSAGK